MTAASLLVDNTIRISMVVSFALCATWLLRGQSAAARHWLLALAIVSAALVPALQLIVPAWQLPGSPSPPSIASRVEGPAQDGATVAAISETPAAAAPAGDAPSNDTVEAAAGWTRLARAVVPVWLAGVALSLALLLTGFARLAWIASRARRITSGRWFHLAARIAGEYDIRRPVAVLQSEHPSVLVTWGTRRPTIVLPAGAPDWSDERALVVLYHELAHVVRHDWPVQILAELLRTAFWFNPLVWAACRGLRLESERACDDAVMERGVSGPDYAVHLLDLARAFHGPRGSWLPETPAPAMARPSSLRTRITAMLDSTRNRRPVSPSTRLTTTIVALAFGAITASAQTTLATLWGTITDQHGGPLVDAALRLSDTGSTRKYEVKSDATGRFEFIGLPAGDYELEAAIPGFTSIRQPLAIAAGQSLQRNLILQVGSLEETLTVGSGSVDAAPAAIRAEPPEWVTAPCTPQPTGGQIRPPVRLADARPQYPANLENSGIDGNVVLKGVIGIDGYFKELQPVEPVQPDLAQAALGAVRQWQFSPTLLNCEPVEVPITITVHFEPDAAPR